MFYGVRRLLSPVYLKSPGPFSASLRVFRWSSIRHFQSWARNVGELAERSSAESSADS